MTAYNKNKNVTYCMTSLPNPVRNDLLVNFISVFPVKLSNTISHQRGDTVRQRHYTELFSVAGLYEGIFNINIIDNASFRYAGTSAMSTVSQQV